MLRSQGSALLMVLFLSSAVLVIFSSFYSVMHEGLKARLWDTPTESIALDDATSGAKYGVVSSLPEGTRVVSQTATGSNFAIFVYSGATTEMTRLSTGAINMTLVDGAAVRVIVPDGVDAASGILFDSLALTTSNTATGSIFLSTLWGYSKLLIGSNSVVQPKTETYILEKDIVNTTFQIRNFQINR